MSFSGKQLKPVSTSVPCGSKSKQKQARKKCRHFHSSVAIYPDLTVFTYSNQISERPKNKKCCTFIGVVSIFRVKKSNNELLTSATTAVSASALRRRHCCCCCCYCCRCCRRSYCAAVLLLSMCCYLDLVFFVPTEIW